MENIRQMVRSEIEIQASAKRFGLVPIPRHTHNNVDSPFIFQPEITYVGIVDHNGIALLLPKGWTAEQTAFSGVYKVTHNLPPGTLYVVSAIASADSGSGHDSVSYSQGSDTSSISFFVFNTIAGTGVVCDFYFTLTVINNKSAQLPTYTGTLAP